MKKGANRYVCNKCRVVGKEPGQCPKCGSALIERGPIDFVAAYVDVTNTLKGIITDFEDTEKEEQKLIQSYIKDEDFYGLLTYYKGLLPTWKEYIKYLDSFMEEHGEFFNGNAIPPAFRGDTKKGMQLLVRCVLAFDIYKNLYKASKDPRLSGLRKLLPDFVKFFRAKGLLGRDSDRKELFIARGPSGLLMIHLTELDFFRDTLDPVEYNRVAELSLERKFSDMEKDLEAILNDPRFPKAAELNSICSGYFTGFSQVYESFLPWKETIENLQKAVNVRIKSAGAIFKSLSEYQALIIEIKEYRRFDKEGLIGRTCTFDSSDVFSGALAKKVDASRKLLAQLKREQAELDFYKSRADALSSCRALRAQVIACRSQDIKNDYLAAQELLSKANTREMLSDANKRLSEVLRYVEYEKELLSGLAQSIGNIKEWVGKLPSEIRKNHKIDARLEHVVSSFQTRELSELEGEVFGLDYLVVRLLHIVKNIAKVNARIKANEPALGHYGRKKKSIFEKISILEKRGDFSEIKYMLYTMNILLDNLSFLSDRDVGACLDLISEGKCDEAIKVMRNAKPVPDDPVLRLKKSLGLSDVKNLELLKRFERLQKAVGFTGIKMFLKGKSVLFGATHKTKDAYPALRDLGIKVHSTETSQMKPISLEPGQVAHFKKLVELIEML